MEGEIQPLNRFPDSSVSSQIRGGQLDEIVFFLVAFDIAYKPYFLLFIFVLADCLVFMLCWK